MVVLSSFLNPTEGIRHEQPDTTAHLNARQLGKGTLYITESRVSWRDGTSGEGFSLEYPHISLHAVSRDLTSFPQECLYLMLDADVEKTEQDSGSEDEEYDGGMTEIRFIPDDKGVLNLLFDALRECQTLHPDPNDSFSDAEDEIFADAEEGDDDVESSGVEGPIIQLRSANADVCEDRNGEMGQDEEMDLDPGQFEDADDFESN